MGKIPFKGLFVQVIIVAIATGFGLAFVLPWLWRSFLAIVA